MNAALLGQSEDAFRMALQRAFLPPAPGARWIGFAQHLQVRTFSIESCSVLCLIVETNSVHCIRRKGQLWRSMTMIVWLS